MHVLTPTVFDLLDELVSDNVRELGQIQLTTALNALARQERYLALETRGSRFNLGVKFGVVEAQIALAMGGVDRERDPGAPARSHRPDRAERRPLDRSSGPVRAVISRSHSRVTFDPCPDSARS